MNSETAKDFNLKLKKLRKENADNADNDAEAMVREKLDSGTFKAVTVCFCDIEGRLHMLDYDKDFLCASANNLTFDGSSIRGFTAQHESDLKIALDWGASYILPPQFGKGKMFIFGGILDKDGTDYSCDMRTVLKRYLKELRSTHNIRVNLAAETEGFIFQGEDVEKTYNQHRKFEYLTTGGYFNTLPGGILRQYIDQVAGAQRVAGFENEKDHPEVAPSQFEINWSYTEALIAADQIQLYKMICRQIAAMHGLTACFLPKPIVDVNGNGMHLNISFTDLDSRKNLFYGTEKLSLSSLAWDFVQGLLYHGEEICLALNSSVNAYRRLDPNFEAPNEIKASSVDRGSMVRIPIGNERSARIEVRTVAPDANPYLAILSILKAGLSEDTEFIPEKMLPVNIYAAIDHFSESKLMREALGKEAHSKYIKWKQEAADRCPKKLGNNIKAGEVMFHHEVTNQQLWSMF